MESELGGVEKEKPYRESSLLENYLGTYKASLGITTIDEFTPTPEQLQDLELLLQKLTEYKSIQNEVTIPILGGKDEFLAGHIVNNVDSFNLKDLKARLQNLPQFEGQPINDKKVIIMLASRLGTLPRRFPDNYLYKSSIPDQLYQGEQGYVSVVYNCFKIHGANLPNNTYWHEAFAGDNFSSYINGVAITVNKAFHETINPLSKFRNLIRRF